MITIFAECALKWSQADHDRFFVMSVIGVSIFLAYEMLWGKARFDDCGGYFTARKAEKQARLKTNANKSEVVWRAVK